MSSSTYERNKWTGEYKDRDGNTLRETSWFSAVDSKGREVVTREGINSDYKDSVEVESSYFD